MTLYVNGEVVEQELIEAEMGRLRPEYERTFAEMEPEKRKKQLIDWSRENVIEQVLLRQSAMKKYPDISEQEVNGFAARHSQGQPVELSDEDKEQIKKQLQFEKLINEISAGLGEPKQGEIEKFYNKHKEHFVIPEMVHAAHIVLHRQGGADMAEQRKELEKVLEQLKDGANFGEIAGKYSDCPEGGGDLGFFARNKMVPAFEDVVFKLEPGEISDVFETEFGVHIAKLIEKREAIPCEIGQVRDVIVKELKGQYLQKALEKYVDKLKGQAEIIEK